MTNFFRNIIAAALICVCCASGAHAEERGNTRMGQNAPTWQNASATTISLPLLPLFSSAPIPTQIPWCLMVTGLFSPSIISGLMEDCFAKVGWKTR